jgi:hypothetical protein
MLQVSKDSTLSTYDSANLFFLQYSAIIARQARLSALIRIADDDALRASFAREYMSLVRISGGC